MCRSVGRAATQQSFMIRIAITEAAFKAITATLPFGSLAVEAEPNERGERLIWLEDAMADRLGAIGRRGELQRCHHADRCPRTSEQKPLEGPRTGRRVAQERRHAGAIDD